ncbi:hypothetical protein [Vibrio parahaemolyticus]|uniref:hypothetical protein n=1 Tax=Vibrio parahaemolyticus TaxID=670 RepID=UPI0037514704
MRSSDDVNSIKMPLMVKAAYVSFLVLLFLLVGHMHESNTPYKFDETLVPKQMHWYTITNERGDKFMVLSTSYEKALEAVKNESNH